MRRQSKVSFGAFLTNMGAPLPLPQKLGLVVRNNWIKLRTGSTCCGHPGQPGC